MTIWRVAAVVRASTRELTYLTCACCGKTLDAALRPVRGGRLAAAETDAHCRHCGRRQPPMPVYRLQLTVVGLGAGDERQPRQLQVGAAGHALFEHQEWVVAVELTEIERRPSTRRWRN